MTSECGTSLPEAEFVEHPLPMNKSTTNKKRCCREIRQKLCRTIHSHNFQIAVIVLVLLDTAVVVSEIMIESSMRTSRSHELEVAEKVLHYLSLTILSIFMVEIFVKIFAMGLKLFEHKFEVFDAIIVSVSFFLDIFISSGGLKDAIEFLILLRLWRITRVINGIIVSIKTQAEEKEEKLHAQIDELNDKLKMQEKEIAVLKTRLAEAGLDTCTT